MKDTVAIVGSHRGTALKFDFSREDCDIWIFNEALHADWVKRADVVFQMHKPVIWRSITNRNDPGHYEWLQNQTGCTVYMIDKFEDVPMSVKFPFDEIMEKYPNIEKYFTSSVAYALALAVYQGYKKMEVYGVEMATQSEYGHQRVGVAYWLGFAAGQGVDVDFKGSILTAPLYGYDGDVQVPIEFFEKRTKALPEHIEGSKKAYEIVKLKVNAMLNDFVKTYKTDLSDLDPMILAMGQNAHNHAMFMSALGVEQHYLSKARKMFEETGEYLIMRQEFESGKYGGMEPIPKATTVLTAVGQTLEKHRKALNTNAERAVREKLVKQIEQTINNYIFSVNELGKWNGIMREHILLLKEYDTYLGSSGIPYNGQADLLAQPVEVLV